jgi:hypothetical protein
MCKLWKGLAQLACGQCICGMSLYKNRRHAVLFELGSKNEAAGLFHWLKPLRPAHPHNTAPRVHTIAGSCQRAIEGQMNCACRLDLNNGCQTGVGLALRWGAIALERKRDDKLLPCKIRR